MVLVRYIHSADQFFPGDTNTISVGVGDITKVIYGISCNTLHGLSGCRKVVLAGPVIYLGTGANTPLPDIVNGDTLTWNISDYSQLNFPFNIDVITNTVAQVGDLISINVTVTPLAGDYNPSNNNFSEVIGVVNSHDPNSKEVSPPGNVNLKTTDWFTYTIRFQNTGYASARNVTIRDTLAANVDASSFQLLDYSSLPTVRITGRYVTFSFSQINLPDTFTDPVASKGFVQYRVKLLPPLNNGTGISNSASIYFDFNQPIVTNTVTNTLICTSDISYVQATICSYESYIWEIRCCSKQGIIALLVQTNSGCDSVIFLQLTVLPPIPVTNLALNICYRDSLPFGGKNIATSGDYTDTLTSSSGCDFPLSNCTYMFLRLMAYLITALYAPVNFTCSLEIR